MRIDHYLKDADQWWSHNPVWCRFVCTICVVEIGVDESIAVLTIAEQYQDPMPGALFMFAMKIIVDAFNASCCSHYIVVSIATSFKNMTQTVLYEKIQDKKKACSLNT